MRTSETRQPPIRIAHLAARLPVGGMETVIAMLARQVPADRFESDIWCLEEPDQLGLELRARGVPVAALGRRSRGDVSLFVRLARQLRRRRIHILHCHDELAWFYGAIAARLVPGVRVVVTFHGRRGDIAPRHLREQWVLARLTARLVCVSEPLRHKVVTELGLAPERVARIVNGIPVDWPPPDDARRTRARIALRLAPSDFVIGAVGELSPVKNLTLAIDAAAQARACIPGLRLVLVGDGSERPALETRIAAYGLGDIVTLTGVRRDVADLLPAFDAYVCSSRYEGTSLSILEAMLQERPVIATDVGGNAELLQHGRCGVLVPSEDPSRMAAAFEHLFANPEARLALGSQAAACVRSHYSIAAMTSEYVELYEST